MHRSSKKQVCVCVSVPAENESKSSSGRVEITEAIILCVNISTVSSHRLNHIAKCTVKSSLMGQSLMGLIYTPMKHKTTHLWFIHVIFMLANNVLHCSNQASILQYRAHIGQLVQLISDRQLNHSKMLTVLINGLNKCAQKIKKLLQEINTNGKRRVYTYQIHKQISKFKQVLCLFKIRCNRC